MTHSVLRLTLINRTTSKSIKIYYHHAIMITIGDKSFKSNIPLESILAVKTKVDMLKRLYGEE